MTLRLQIDPGGEKYLSFAKQKLRQLKEWMANARLSSARKYFEITAGESVLVHSVQTGPGLFLDFIRITYGTGSIILQTGTNEYAVVRWDGSLVALADTTGHPHSGFAMHEAIDNLILFCPRIGASAYTAYTVNAENFSAVNGPEDYSADGYASFTYRQPAESGGVLPPKQWVAGIDLLSGVALPPAPVAVFEQDFSGLSSATFSSGSTGTLQPTAFQWNSNGTHLFVEIGRDSSGSVPEFAMLRVDPDTAAYAVIAFAGTNTGADSQDPLVPMCVNTTKALRPTLVSGAVYLDVRSLDDGSQLANILLPEATQYAALRADDTRAFVVVTTASGHKGFTVDLTTYAVTDISEKLNAWMTSLQAGNVSLSRAIILPGNITGAVAAPPEGGGGGGPRP